jgi:KaiC/GvpD/RAD55 family RecA-like ATPase
LYPGAINWLAGEPGNGKTFVALAAATEVLRAGGRVMVLDYEDTDRTCVSRLLSIGASVEEFVRVQYMTVGGAIGDTGVAWLTSEVADGVDLVIVDSAPESIAAEGFNENSASEVASWVARIPRALARARAAVFVIDHVAKSTEHRGRWARGSGHKLAAVDGTALLLVQVVPFSRERSGSSHLNIAKDRHGQIGAIGQVAATVTFTVERGSLCRIDLSPPRPQLESQRTGVRIDLTEVVDVCRERGGQWASIKAAADDLGVTRATATAALEEAVYAGLLVEDRSRGKRAFRVVEETDWDQLLALAHDETNTRSEAKDKEP